MSSNIIPPSEADLLLHRLVTERIRILAWFVSADRSVHAKFVGFVTSSTPDGGLHIGSEWIPLGGPPIPCWMVLRNVAGSVCRYSDETEVPPDFEYRSGLRLEMPNGDSLTIMEIRQSQS